MKKQPITVTMISGAEATRIERALESVAGWTSEIVVVLNDDVRDGTEEIALKYGAKVFREPWQGYIEGKNSSAGKATQDWLLGLDADEAVSPALRDEIIATISATGQPTQPAAYSFPRLSYYCGRWIRHGDWYPDRKTRLWRRGQGKFAGLNPHDRLEVTGTVVRLKNDLFHFSNESIEKQIGKIVPYQREFVRQRVAAGATPGFFGLVLRPWWKFLRSYIFRLGFLDGWQGYYIARFSAFSTLTRQALVREAQLPLCPPPKSP